VIPPDSWRKSSYSGSGDGNACVEVALRHPRIAVRDSKDPSRTPLTVSVPAFSVFVGALKDGEGRLV
jgi:hypothetical protein